MVAAVVTALTLSAGIFSSVQPAGGKLLVSGSTGSACVWLTVDEAALAYNTRRGSGCDLRRRESVGRHADLGRPVLSAMHEGEGQPA